MNTVLILIGIAALLLVAMLWWTQINRAKKRDELYFLPTPKPTPSPTEPPPPPPEPE